MVDVKISALGAITTVAGEDLVAIIDDPSGTPVSKKATIDQIKTYINAPELPVVDTTEIVKGSADATKKLRFEVDGNTTSVTGVLATAFTTAKTLTFPDATDTLVGKATTDTLTNKTLTSPIISTISNTGTLTLPTSTDTLVGRATTDTLTNKTLTTPIISSISNTGTITLPTSTDTLVGRATTDTLTNKSIDLTNNTLSTTLAQLNTAVSDATLVDLDDSQTLSNKTINADNNTITNLAVGAEVATTLTETEEIWIPAGAFTSATTNGAEITSRESTTNKVNYHYAGFDTTTSEIAWFTWTPPANWNAGTVRYKLYWTNTAGLSTETIDFDLSAVAFADDDSIDTAVGTAQNITDTFIAQGDLHISAYSSAITIAGSPTAGEEVHFKLSRDVASDNLTGDCDVIGILLEYSVNDIGTT